MGISVRKYGSPPYKIALLHGGPGAPGYMASLARELARKQGILEPLQSRDSLEGQIEELREQLAGYADLPAILIGSSWGAVLALLTAARHNQLMRKLILVGCPVFDSASSAQIGETRKQRLDNKEQAELETLQKELAETPPEKRAVPALKWMGMFFKCDTYDPLVADLETIEFQYEISVKVWGDFIRLRDEPGYLKKEFAKIRLPVCVIHGEYDPHPVEGFRPFLESCLEDVDFHILPRCGHYPWIERYAARQFYEILQRELSE